MKHLILTACLFTAFLFASAQDTTWTKDDAVLYGTPTEKRQQMNLANKAGYELYRLIGFKEFYANGLSLFMQMHGYNADGSSNFKGGTVYTFSPKAGFGKPQKVYFKYWVDAKKRITKARVTGYNAALVDLFLAYWPTDPQWSTTAQLKRGTVATKMLIDEKITFNYQAQQPFIEVSK